MKANPHERAALEVLSFINECKGVIATAKDQNEEYKPEDMPEVDTLVFSDTIVLTCELDERDASTSLFALASFVNKVASLSRHMFEFGLPIRGAIHYGDFRVMDHSFVGTALADAHLLGESLALSAVVISKEFLAFESKLLAVVFDHDLLFRTAAYEAVRYNVPTKSGLVMAPMVNPYTHHISKVVNSKVNLKDSDLSDYVLKSFWGHGKHMDLSAEIKARNTEQYIRYCKFKLPNDFS